jgi:serine/threonine-protein kinase RsbW
MVVSGRADRARPPNVHLSLSSRPENVAVVRQMLGGLAEAIDVDATDLSGIIAAVTEACNNVVVHAYGGAEGPLEIDVYARPYAIEVVVRDRGNGIRPQTSNTEETGGIGLHVIHALSERADFKGTEDGGTEVWMAFDTAQTRALEPFPDGSLELPTIGDGEPASALEISIAPAPLARTILPALLSVLAARAYFRTDRIADMRLVADALTAQVPGSIIGSHLSIGISVEPHDLELRIAPLPTGAANRLMLDSAVYGLPPVVDDHRVASLDPCRTEMLALRLVDPL